MLGAGLAGRPILATEVQGPKMLGRGTVMGVALAHLAALAAAQSNLDPRHDFILSLAFAALCAVARQCGDAAAGERSALAEPGWRASRYGRARLGP